MDRILQKTLGLVIRQGTLQVTTAAGRTFTVGEGTGTRVAVRFVKLGAQISILLDPDLRLGEAYTDGTFVVEEGSIADFLALVLSQEHTGAPSRWARPLWAARYIRRRAKQFNWRGRSRRNVAHHYDLDSRIYSLFLDADRQYSCAYFETPDQSLGDAQLAKKRHLAAKLLVRRHHTVLDIGSGWGGLALYLAETCGAQVTGITLSEEQLTLSRRRAVEHAVTERVAFRLQDYRDVAGPFDRIVSVGMFEHVGINFYDRYFQKCAELLAPDGVLLLHSIGRPDGAGITNPWIDKYIFPGGYIPALSEVFPAIERSGLLVTDIEILRPHYAETLKAWRERFLAHREEVEQLFDRRFVRMWEFYLAASEVAFRKLGFMVFQIQMAKRQDVVPGTRDYISAEEYRLRGVERSSRAMLRLAGE